MYMSILIKSLKMSSTRIFHLEDSEMHGQFVRYNLNGRPIMLTKMLELVMITRSKIMSYHFQGIIMANILNINSDHNSYKVFFGK